MIRATKEARTYVRPACRAAISVKIAMQMRMNRELWAPKVFRRLRVELAAISSVSLAMGATSAVIACVWPGSIAWRACLLAAYSGAAVLLIRAIHWYRTWKRTLHSLHENDFRVCGDCLYPLAGLLDKHKCPECGREYSFTDLRNRWKEYLTR